MDMMLTKQRIAKLVSELDSLRLSHVIPAENIMIAPGKGGMSEKPADFDAFENGGSWGGADLHFWFNVKVTIPQEYEGRTALLNFKTGREGEWDATNPQFLAFVNGQVVQGLDVNHRELFLSDSAKPGDEFDVSLYAYSGSDSRKAFFNCSMAVLEADVEAIYYDLRVALEAAECLHKQDKRRIDILKYLEETVALIDFRKAYCYDKSFIDSVKKAHHYITKNFYEDYCGHEDFAVSGIGHTHIDVAWLWTLAVTRGSNGPWSAATNSASSVWRPGASPVSGTSCTSP
jgi:alpha-mannosidase